MSSDQLAEQIRHFNRFYTELIGALDDRHEGLAVNLAQSRLLYTAARLGQPQVSAIAEALKLDLAYTSRILGELELAKLIRRRVSSIDRRQRVVKLTAAGERVLANIVQRSNVRVLQLVDHLDQADTNLLLESMSTIRRLLDRTEPNPQLRMENR